MIVASSKTCISEKVHIGKFFAQPNGYYCPFGKEARGSSTSNEPKEQFSGKQFDQESGLNYFGARYYNPEIRRFTTKDRFKEKLPHLTPYQYAANNPIIVIDQNGDGLNVSQVQGAKEYNDLISDLEEQTGFSYSVTGTGNLIISGKKHDDGSKKAQKLITDILGHKKTGTLKITKGSDKNGMTRVTENKNIILNKDFVEGAIGVGVSSKTAGWGMAFMYEASHTEMGGDYSDDVNSSSERSTLTLMNSIRGELGRSRYGEQQQLTPEHTVFRNGQFYNKYNYSSDGKKYILIHEKNDPN